MKAAMKAAIRKLWLEALRNADKYNQGQGKLRSWNDCFCCLGVLCDILQPDQWTKSRYPEEPYAHCGLNDLPSHDILIAADLHIEAVIELSAMNDGIKKYSGTPKTFLEIADWIEANISEE